MDGRTFTAADFREYRQLLEQKQDLTERLRKVEEKIRDLENGQPLSEDVNLPENLSATYDALEKLGGRARLDQIFRNRRPKLSRAGVRAQLITLQNKPYRVVRQTGAWGEWEITRGDL